MTELLAVVERGKDNLLTRRGEPEPRGGRREPARGRRASCCRRRTLGSDVREIRLRTARRSHVVDITRDVRDVARRRAGSAVARLRPAHDRRRDDQRARRSRRRARLRGGARAHGRGRLAVGAHRAWRGERADARPRGAHGVERRGPAARGRVARARHVAGDLLLRVRRAARAIRLRERHGASQ